MTEQQSYKKTDVFLICFFPVFIRTQDWKSELSVFYLLILKTKIRNKSCFQFLVSYEKNMKE